MVFKETEKGKRIKMYEGIIKKKPEVGQLLVRLYDRNKLYNLSKNPNAQVKEELTNVFADLLDFDLSPSESELITEALIGIVVQAEIDLRAALAERLSTQDDVPLRILLHLANDEIDVAMPILQKSEGLTDTDLTYIVKAKKEEHWRAIAQRTHMTEILINALADTEDLLTAISLSLNTNITMTNYAIDKLANMARISDALAEPFMQRKDVPEHVLSELYQHVGRALKENIRHSFGSAIAQKAGADIDQIIFEIHKEENLDFAPTLQMIVQAENMMEKGFLTADIMIDNLRRGQITNFIALFSVYCGLEHETVLGIMRQDSAQGLAVACKAVNISKPEFVNMFLLTHRVRTNGERVIHKSELGKALKYYDTITESMARGILNESRH